MVLAHNIHEKIRTKDVQISSNVTFESMLLSSRTVKGLHICGFYKPSPVQLLGIPFGKCGFDLLLEAKSGTGKTAVFSVIALEKIDLRKNLQVIILAPTREIVAQICDVLRQIGSNFEELGVEVVMGGLPIQDDIIKFKKENIHIVVGSPGRLKHLISDKHINVSAVRLLILDEADKLMDKSFLSDIKYINSSLPRQKQVIMSSATYPESSKEFIAKFVYSAQHVCPNTNSVLLGVRQKITTVQYNSNIVKQTQYRFKVLMKMLTKIQFKQCLIFCNYQIRVAELHQMLRKTKWPAEKLHGQQDQMARLDALKTLQDYKCRILVSTDLASRGIDASNIDLVINFEPPFDWQTYLHRIGRAGRFGSYGAAITILSEGPEKIRFMKIIEFLNAPVTDLQNDEDTVDQEHIEMSSTDTLLVDEIDTNTQSELLKTICNSDKSCSTDGIDSLDQLYRSFNISKNDKEFQNIESFSDLLHSYEITDNSSQQSSSQYKCLTFPATRCLKSKQLSAINFEINGNVIEDMSNLGNEDFKEQPNIYLKNDKEEYLRADNVNFDASNVLVENKITMNLSNSLEFNELGLPTSFMTTKSKRKNEKKQKRFFQRHNKHHEPIKLLDYHQPHSNVTTESQLNAKKEKSKYQLKYKNGRNYESDFSYNNTFNKSSTTLPKIESNKSNISQVCGFNPKKPNFNENQEHKKIYMSKKVVDSCCFRDSNSYYKWYNQLKLRTMQVQMSTYIKELSEL